MTIAQKIIDSVTPLAGMVGEDSVDGSATIVKTTSQAAHVYVASAQPGDNQVLGVKETAPVATPYRVTADGQVILGPCIVYGFVATAGTTPTIAMYDGTNTSGALIYGSGATETASTIKAFPCAVECATGLYIDVGGTSPAFTVYARA